MDSVALTPELLDALRSGRTAEVISADGQRVTLDPDRLAPYIADLAAGAYRIIQIDGEPIAFNG